MEIKIKQQFEHISLQENKLVENIQFKNCSFYSCDFSDRISLPQERSIIKNSIFENCTVNNNCGIGNGIIEDVELINLKTKGIVFCLGTLFNKVTFRGKCGSFRLTSETVDRAVHNGEDISKSQIEAFNHSAQEFYKGVDWALDISNAEFKELQIDPDIPAALVKRNPETQILIRKENIDVAKIQQHPYIFSLHKRHLTSNKYDQIIVISTISNKHLEEEMKSIQILREEGIADIK